MNFEVQRIDGSEKYVDLPFAAAVFRQEQACSNLHIMPNLYYTTLVNNSVLLIIPYYQADKRKNVYIT